LSRIVKRVLITLMIAGVVGAGLAIIPDLPSETKEFEITDAKISIQLQKDGSLLVHEALPFDFNGNFTGAYRDIPLNGDAKITDVSVSENGRRYKPGGDTALGSYDTPGSFGTEIHRGTSDVSGATDTSRNRTYLRVVWHYQARDETRTFDLDYRVVNAANVRDDVVDVTWTIWGDQWDFWLHKLDADISAASGVAPLKSWVRPRSLGAEPDVGDSASVSIDRLKEGQNVGMRAVFPRNAITSTSGANVEPGDGLPGIEEEEAGLDDDYSTVDKLENFVVDNAIAVTVGLTLLGLLSVAGLCLLARERSVDVPKYLSEPPEDISPALGFALAREGEYDQRVILAVLLDLVDRGFYEAKPAPGKDLDLEVRVAEKRPDPSEGALEKYEVTTLDFFDRLLGTKWVAIGKMKDEVPEHSSSWRSRWENLNEQLDDAETGKISWERDMSGRRYLLILLFILLFAGVILLTWLRTHLLAIPVTGLILTVGLMTAPPDVWFKRLSTASRLRSAQWQAFERWTRDFPRLDDDPPATLKLWRRILVYAVAFGTAERVAKSGRIPAPVAEEANAGGYWPAYAFYGGSFGSSFDGFGSGFSSQVAPQSSSSGGGGFSGGGGGGFSGGGGGGAW
jgi:uncharacterized membrane protein YgcG